VEESLGSIVGVAATTETSNRPCEKCGGPMNVWNTIKRWVATLRHGPFETREVIRFCKGGCTTPSGHQVTRRSEALQQIVPAGANYGYDVEVFVGTQRFLHHRQREEIRNILRAEYGLPISSGEISTLARRFLSHLNELHLAYTEKIRQAFIKDGGYPLHIDATGEDGRGTLFVAYAGWREWVLGAWKIPTERSDEIIPHLQDVVKKFGEPRAVVRDLGRAVTGAAEDLVRRMAPQPPVLACHLHFLKDVGKDLLKRDHDRLRQLVRNFKVRSKLTSFVRQLGRRLGEEVPFLRESVESWAKGPRQPLPAGQPGLAIVRALGQWVLDYSHDGRHQGFPFDRPYLDLFHRCCAVHRAVNIFKQTSTSTDVLRALDRLGQVLAPVTAEVAAQKVAEKLEVQAKQFDELRNVLRLDSGKPLAKSPNVVSNDEQAEWLQKIKQEFTDYCQSLQERRAARGGSKDEQRALDIVGSHLERHGQYLWGHVLQMPEEVGGGIRIVARTNNILEGFFHQMKHGERRRSGRKVLTQDFEGLPAAAALTCNLTRPDYVQLVCGSLEELPARFSALDVARRETQRTAPKGTLAKPTPSGVVSASLPLADRRLVRKDSLRDRIQAAANRQQLKSPQQSQSVPIHTSGAAQSQLPGEETSRFIIYVPHRRVPIRTTALPTRPHSKTPPPTPLGAARSMQTSVS